MISGDHRQPGLSGPDAVRWPPACAHPSPSGSITLSARLDREHLKEIAEVADTLVCVYPSAGLPNEFGLYDESRGDGGRDRRLRARWAGQHRRRLLRLDAQACRGDCDGGGGRYAARPEAHKPLLPALPASSRSRPTFPSSTSANAPTSPARPVPQAGDRRRLHPRARGGARSRWPAAGGSSTSALDEV